MALQVGAKAEPGSGSLRFLDEATARLWRGLFIGLAVSLAGFWGPLGLVVWWWVR